MNIECEQITLDELISGFRFNDAVLRHMVIKRESADTEPSPLMRKDDDRPLEDFSRDMYDSDSDDSAAA